MCLLIRTSDDWNQFSNLICGIPALFLTDPAFFTTSISFYAFIWIRDPSELFTIWCVDAMLFIIYAFIFVNSQQESGSKAIYLFRTRLFLRKHFLKEKSNYKIIYALFYCVCIHFSQIKTSNHTHTQKKRFLLLINCRSCHFLVCQIKKSQTKTEKSFQLELSLQMQLNEPQFHNLPELGLAIFSFSRSSA